MAEPFQFDLVSPERLLMSEEVEEVVVPGAEGDFGVLKDHAPFMSTIRPGFIEITKVGGEKVRIFVHGGFADTGAAGLTVLAEQAIPADELDRAELAESIKNAEDDVADATDDVVRAARAQKLEQLREIERALS